MTLTVLHSHRERACTDTTSPHEAEVFDELDADEEDLQIQAVPLAARSDLDNNTRLALASSDSEHVIDVDNLDLEQAISLTASQEEVQSSTALRLAKSGYSLVNRLVLGHDEALFRCVMVVGHTARLSCLPAYLVTHPQRTQGSACSTNRAAGNGRIHVRAACARWHLVSR